MCVSVSVCVFMCMFVCVCVCLFIVSLCVCGMLDFPINLDNTVLRRAYCKYLPNLITASALETPYCTEPVCVGRAHHATFPPFISEEGE